MKEFNTLKLSVTIVLISLLTFTSCSEDEEPKASGNDSENYFTVDDTKYALSTNECDLNGQYLGFGGIATSPSNAGVGVTVDGVPTATKTYTISTTAIENDKGYIYVNIQNGPQYVAQSGTFTITVDGSNLVYEFSDLPATDETETVNVLLSGKFSCTQ